MNMFLEKTEKLKKTVRKSESGHLPLNERVDLLNRITAPNAIRKIFFECLKKVYPVWEQEYPNHQTMKDIITKADTFLYHQSGNIQEFESYYNTHINYFQSIDGVAGLTGMTALALCRNIAYSGITVENYEGEDDDVFDWQDWNPDFYASMAYSGGNPFFNEGNVFKRKEFWNWYLDMIIFIIENVNKPLLLLSQKEIPQINGICIQRTQSSNEPLVSNIIKQIIDYSIEDLIKLNDNPKWKSIEIEGFFLKMGNRALSYYISDNNDRIRMKISRHFPEDITTSNLLHRIKLSMYQQRQNEGAWFQCKLTFYPDKSYDIIFNYDNKEVLPEERLKEPVYFIEEFKIYPRSKEYTPEWWQNILGKKAKYLPQ
jgi:hypothetical protein